MILDEQNYFSAEAGRCYFSTSQYKDFCGTVGMRGCEAAACAKLSGDWEDEVTTPMLVGSYVDAHFSGTLDVFKGQHPELLKKDGGLKAEYIKADEIILRIERDAYFVRYLSGEKQVILTGEIFGVPWKVKIDCLDRDLFIADLKVMASLCKAHYAKDHGYMSFIEFWGYNIQAAVYQEVVRQNIGKRLPFFIAGVSKEKQPDIEIIGFNQQDLDDTLSLIEPNIERIKKLKCGKLTADRCGVCDYCKFTKELTNPIHYSNLILNI